MVRSSEKLEAIQSIILGDQVKALNQKIDRFSKDIQAVKNRLSEIENNIDGLASAQEKDRKSIRRSLRSLRRSIDERCAEIMDSKADQKDVETILNTKQKTLSRRKKHPLKPSKKIP